MATEGDVEIERQGADEFDYDLNETGATLEDFTAMGINPFKSTKARPGSEEKVLMLSARYAAGLPLWHNEDCYEHGPHESDLMGAMSDSRSERLPQIDLDDE